MVKRFVMMIAVGFMTMSAIAAPAKRGTWKMLTLADGTEVKAMLVGDEFDHFWQTEDGKVYKKSGDYYQLADAQAAASRATSNRKKAAARRAMRAEDASNAFVGSKKGLVVLVNFKDCKFLNSHGNAMYNRFLNEAGYSEGKSKGSLSDYFKDQSLGLFDLTFDVYGPVTVSKNYSYYGANDEDDNDKHPGQMVCEAVNLIKNQVTNWKQYDWDDDGEVDQIYVIYAGYGESDSDDENTIWPHAFSLDYAYQYYRDGTGPISVASHLKVNNYACGPEYDGTGILNGIGTIAHEYSHCLGLPDFYDVDYSGGQGLGEWDLMDQGTYNGDGYVPPSYSSYERWLLGWMTPIELDAQDVSVEKMKALGDGGDAYIIYNKGNKNEFLMLENRQRKGWDAYVPESGLLMLHCDYDAQVWEENGPNDDPNHQRMAIVPADGRCQSFKYSGSTYYTFKTDVFPQGTVKSFNKDFVTYDNVAKKAACFFNMNTNGTFWIDSSIEEITKNGDGTISFKFVSSNTISTGITSAQTDSALQPGFYTIDGRHIGSDFSTLKHGLYIINGKKVVK